MVVKCQNCGHGNQEISIFCRKCGTKLAKGQYTKAFIHKKKQKSFLKVIRWTGRIIAIAIVGILLYALFLIFQPSFSQAKLPGISKAEFLNAIKKLHSFELQIQPKYNFSPSEATVLYNSYFLPGKLRSQPLTIKINLDNTVTFLLRKKLDNAIPLTVNCSITGLPSFNLSSNNKILPEFTVTKVKLGNLYMPGITWNYVIKMFKPYYSNRTKRLLKKVNKLDVNKSTGFTVYLKGNSLT